ncbi:hypothetical protein OG607_03150 [Streptomyces sp. NBC_01537]|uniref:hypothetical protein n=1 Tax=Streptomyces sp. NBC_01537 TaxID=2903896 RepID=UPI00386F15C0
MSSRYSGNQAAVVIIILADVAAAILGLWILLYVLDANRGNELVKFVHHSADWLAGWSRDLFMLDTDWLRILINYGLAAVVYLALAHVVAGRIRRS